MSRPSPAVADPVDQADAGQDRTGRAFLLAPGLAAMIGSFLLTPMLGWEQADLGLFAFVALSFAFVGYSTALVLAAPVYLLLPETARGAAVIVPLAGVLAAAPWALLSAATGGVSPEYVAVVVAFGMGCLGGVNFVLIRGERLSADGGAARGSGA